MGQGALSKPVVQWWLSLNSSTGQAAKLVAISFTPLRDAKPLTVQRARGGADARGDGQGGRMTTSVDCPSPSGPLVYVSRLQTARPDG